MYIYSKIIKNDGLSRSLRELNDGMMNDELMNDGLMNDGLSRSLRELNDGLMNDGLMNDGLVIRRSGFSYHRRPSGQGRRVRQGRR